MSEQGKEDSVDLTYEFSKEAIKLQLKQRYSLETKASTLIAFAGVIFALMMGALDTLKKLTFYPRILVISSVIFFFISIISCTIVLWVRYYRINPRIDVLAEKYLPKSEKDSKLQLISNLIQDWSFNQKTVERNAQFLRLAFISQTIAFIIFGLALMLSIWMS